MEGSRWPLAAVRVSASSMMVWEPLQFENTFTSLTTACHNAQPLLPLCCCCPHLQGSMTCAACGAASLVWMRASSASPWRAPVTPP